MKDQLIFNTDSVETLAASDSVGAYVRASDGSLIDSVEVATVKRLAVDSTLKDGAGNALTSTGGALDVNLASPLSIDVDLDHITGDSVQIGDGVEIMAVNADGSINAVVSATDLDIRDLSSATDSVSAVQSGTWNVTVDNPFDGVVSATDFDIRDLAFATDSVTAHQGGTWNVTVDNPFDGVVTATDLDIRDLTHVDDSVKIGDGTNLIGSTEVSSVYGLNTYVLNEEFAVNLQDGVGAPLSSTAGALNVYVDNAIEVEVNDVALAETAIAAAKIDTAGDVVASPLANRKYLYIYNQGNKKIFLGPNGVTIANGFPVSPGSYIELRAGAAVDIEFAQDGGTVDVRSLELA
jgi:hypothetical protein